MGKLDAEQVRSIYRDSRTYQEIADDFGITVRQIGNIKRRVVWADETDGLECGKSPIHEQRGSTTRSAYLPSPDEIKKSCSDVRATWDEETELKRRLGITNG